MRKQHWSELYPERWARVTIADFETFNYESSVQKQGFMKIIDKHFDKIKFAEIMLKNNMGKDWESGVFFVFFADGFAFPYAELRSIRPDVY